jgi:hypothetical protein
VSGQGNDGGRGSSVLYVITYDSIDFFICILSGGRELSAVYVITLFIYLFIIYLFIYLLIFYYLIMYLSYFVIRVCAFLPLLDFSRAVEEEAGLLAKVQLVIIE